jgi:hypothetical protein
LEDEYKWFEFTPAEYGTTDAPSDYGFVPVRTFGCKFKNGEVQGSVEDDSIDDLAYEMAIWGSAFKYWFYCFFVKN